MVSFAPLFFILPLNRFQLPPGLIHHLHFIRLELVVLFRPNALQFRWFTQLWQEFGLRFYIQNF